MSDQIVLEVIEKYAQRSEIGIAKYGTTLETNNKDNYLKHLQEELMDATLYLEKLIVLILVVLMLAFFLFIINIKNIEKAIELYDLVINDPMLIPELKAQSLLNAGKGDEALRRFDKAKDYYTQASLLGDKTGAGALAVKYLKNLQDNQIDLATFYKNFD